MVRIVWFDCCVFVVVISVVCSLFWVFIVLWIGLFTLVFGGLYLMLQDSFNLNLCVV